MRNILKHFAGILGIRASNAAMAKDAEGGMRIAAISMETERPLEGVNVAVSGAIQARMRSSIPLFHSCPRVPDVFAPLLRCAALERAKAQR